MFGTIKIEESRTALFAAAVLVCVAASEAWSAPGPFSDLAGTWSGNGAVMLWNGVQEPIRCRATYHVDRSGAQVDIFLRCASASQKFELQSRATQQNGNVSGTWVETTHRAQGTIYGRAAPGRILVNVQGALNGRLALNTKNNMQSITIELPGSMFSGVSIALRKGAN